LLSVQNELKSIQDQVDMLRQATEKRVNIFQTKQEKIQEQIEFILRENEELKAQGANLDVISPNRAQLIR